MPDASVPQATPLDILPETTLEEWWSLDQQDLATLALRSRPTKMSDLIQTRSGLRLVGLSLALLGSLPNALSLKENWGKYKEDPEAASEDVATLAAFLALGLLAFPAFVNKARNWGARRAWTRFQGSSPD